MTLDFRVIKAIPFIYFFLPIANLILWLLMKYMFVINYSEFSIFNVGFFFLSLIAAILGTFLLIIYLFFYRTKPSLTLCLMIASLPISYATSLIENKLENENVVKLYNNSGEDIYSFKLIGFKDTYDFGALKHQDFLIICYNPDYNFGDARKYLDKSNPKLIIKTKYKVVEARFPNYWLGDIIHLSLGKEFQADTGNDYIRSIQIF